MEMEKIVSQLDQAGYFVMPVTADRSREDGTWLIPGGAIDVPPPTVPEGKVALWMNGDWAFVDPPVVDPEEPPPTSSVESQRRAILRSVGCVNETHLDKDIWLAEGLGDMTGLTPGPEGTLYARNPSYRALLTAKQTLGELS